jgi:ATP-dependent helicase/nuclease subunit A
MDEAMAMRRGSLIHLLLEHLPNKPEADWERLSQSLMQQYDNKTDNAEMRELLDIAAGVLKTDALKPVFAPDALAEVNITAHIPELDGRQIYGTIDRLVISDNRITAVDFKSNRVVPETPFDTPIGLLRQMGAYLSALKQIYPDHEINVTILWTQNQKLMSLPHDIVIDALKATTTS